MGAAKILYTDSTVTVKELTFATLAKTSLHYHMRRYETLYVQSGSFSIRVYNPEKEVFETFTLKPGMSFKIGRGYIHEVLCHTFGVLIETSLTYEEEDIVRIYDETLLRRGPSMR